MTRKNPAAADRAPDLKPYIRDVPDWPVPGICFRDISTLLASPKAFRQACDSLVDRYRAAPPDRVLAIDARGFLFAGVLAHTLGLPLVPVRKAGKLPHHCLRVAYDLEYGHNELEIHRDAVSAGDRVVIIDDLLATGGTMAAAISLVQQLGAAVVEAACVIELDGLGGRQRLAPVSVYTLVHYQED